MKEEKHDPRQKFIRENEYIEVVNDVIFNELCLGNALVGARAGKSDIFVIY